MSKHTILRILHTGIETRKGLDSQTISRRIKIWRPIPPEPLEVLDGETLGIPISRPKN